MYKQRCMSYIILVINTKLFYTFEYAIRVFVVMIVMCTAIKLCTPSFPLRVITSCCNNCKHACRDTACVVVVYVIIHCNGIECILSHVFTCTS